MYKVCSVCVMDASDPEIEFDDLGECNHCRTAKDKLRKGWFPDEQGQKFLGAIAEEIRKYGENKEYDCIIGVSGGVDSSYLLHVAKVEMKLNPLVVHVDAGWNSEIAVSNIEKMVNKLGLDLHTYVVDWSEMKDLQVAYLKSSLANQDVPQDHAFFAKLYELADKEKIKYTLTGSNLSSESILPAAWGYGADDSIQIKAIHNKFGRVRLKSFPLMSFWENKIYWPYFKKMVVVTPLNFLNYNKNEAISFLEKNYEWRYYGGKHHESKWTKFFQAHYLPEKFGYDKRKAHFSSMIVAGQMSRVEAVKELEKPLYDAHELVEDIFYIEKKLGLKSGELESFIKLPNKVFSDYPNQTSVHDFFRGLKRFVRRRR
ncbi:N-acetyl sugar amidotransferase [Stutzerimonas stutzeri]|uniref:N-acetyl sugar amidotransferase n=1 Tax=Stutzerimonas stutzeri TaxID=316 RepID=UPI0021096D97|nr:N-acetyl sugar amidotransferase [Stutzerimonas stutzeri]